MATSKKAASKKAASKKAVRNKPAAGDPAQDQDTDLLNFEDLVKSACEHYKRGLPDKTLDSNIHRDTFHATIMKQVLNGETDTDLNSQEASDYLNKLFDEIKSKNNLVV